MEFTVVYKESVQCSNGTNFEISFLKEKSRILPCWQDDYKRWVLTKTTENFLLTCQYSNTAPDASVFVSSKYLKSTAIEVKMNNAVVNAYDLQFLYDYLSDFIKEPKFLLGRPAWVKLGMLYCFTSYSAFLNWQIGLIVLLICKYCFCFLFLFLLYSFFFSWSHYFM